MPNWRRCVHGYEKKVEECADWAEEAHEECTSWRRGCKKWIPIPIIGDLVCGLVGWVCAVVVKIFEWVCVAWNVFTTFVCLVWETAMFLAAPLGIIVKAILALPIIGALIRTIINLITALVFGIIGFVVEGVLCGLAGICPKKNLRLCIIAFQYQGAPVISEAALQPVIDKTKQVYLDEANIVVHSSYHFHRHEHDLALSPNCNFGGWLEEFWLRGTQYQEASYLNCSEDSVASIIGIGSPIYAFPVLATSDSNKAGCSFGPLSNWVVFNRSITTPTGNPCLTTLAHELGHACGLWLHDSSDQTNVMFTPCNDQRGKLSRFQKSIVRGSKYVTYF